MNRSCVISPSQQPRTPSSTLTLLQEYAAANHMLLFEAAYLYHHKDFIRLPLLLVAPKQGLILFDRSSWRADMLKNATVRSWHPSLNRAKAISVDDALEQIRQQANYLLHQDLDVTTAMVWFERLSSQDFEQLDSSFQYLIPRSRALFCNETPGTLSDKITASLAAHTLTLDTTALLATLFIQYTLPPDHFNTHISIADSNQQRYIDDDFLPRGSLVGPYGSGKSSIMLLKVLTYRIRYPQQQIMIIAPSLSACDLLKQKMLGIIEHALIDVDLSTIDVITPEALLTRHARKLYRKPPLPVGITDKMLQKPFHVADIIVCDDADLLCREFLTYLQHLQQKQCLHLLCTHQSTAIGVCHTLTKSYRIHAELEALCRRQDLSAQHSYETSVNIKLCVGNIYMQTILAFKEMLKANKHTQSSLIITPNRAFSQALHEQMHAYIEEEILLFNTQESMIDTLFKHHIIVEHNHMASLYAEHVMIAGIHPENRQIFCHALSRGYKSIDIILHDDSHTTINLQCEDYF